MEERAEREGEEDEERAEREWTGTFSVHSIHTSLDHRAVEAEAVLGMNDEDTQNKVWVWVRDMVVGVAFVGERYGGGTFTVEENHSLEVSVNMFIHLSIND